MSLNYLIIMTVIGVVFVSGCTNISTSEDFNNVVTTLSICDNIENDDDFKNYCKAFEFKDQSHCEKIEEKGTYHGDSDDCYYDLSRGFEEIDACDSIKDPTKRWECKAFKEKDSNLCENVNKNDRNWCFRRVALVNEDASSCDRIVISADNTREDLELKSGCFMSLALQINDIGACKQILVPDFYFAQENLDYWTSVKQNPENYSGSCEESIDCVETSINSSKQHYNTYEKQNVNTISACERQIMLKQMKAGIIEMNVSICDQNVQCVIEFIEISGESEYCNVLTDNDYKNYCIGLINIDESFCFNIDNNLRERCFSEIAKQKGDLNICYELESPDFCIVGVNGNCELFENEENKNYCYYENAVESKDESFCIKIEKLSQKNLCYEQIVNRISRGL